ncbi:hypothetical protein BDZ91DRAFT_784507 [Kalaharituber pfeilii]|nr:hypothetical protein BDZ91DRAFT_784507 [Kalaharituber pfeilii]
MRPRVRVARSRQVALLRRSRGSQRVYAPAVSQLEGCTSLYNFPPRNQRAPAPCTTLVAPSDTASYNSGEAIWHYVAHCTGEGERGGHASAEQREATGIKIDASQEGAGKQGGVRAGMHHGGDYSRGVENEVGSGTEGQGRDFGMRWRRFRISEIAEENGPIRNIFD